MVRRKSSDTSSVATTGTSTSKSTAGSKSSRKTRWSSRRRKEDQGSLNSPSTHEKKKKCVDICFSMEDPVPLEKKIRQVDTSSTTFRRLKDMARFHLKIRGKIELWLVGEDGELSCLGLQRNDLISHAITEDCKLIVEQLVPEDEEDYWPSRLAEASPRESHSKKIPTAKMPPTDSSGEEDRKPSAIAASSWCNPVATILKRKPRTSHSKQAVTSAMDRAASSRAVTSYNPAASIPRRSSEGSIPRRKLSRAILCDNDTDSEKQSPSPRPLGVVSQIASVPKREPPPREESKPEIPASFDSHSDDSSSETEYAHELSWGDFEFDAPVFTEPTATSSSESDASAPLGTLIVKASSTQFTVQGGRSACTSICLVAAAQILSRIHQSPQCITTELLDSFLQVGVLLHQNVTAHDHTSVDDLWSLPAYDQLVSSLLRRDTPLTGSIGQMGEWEECLMTTLSYAEGQGKNCVALIVTKPPESILLVCQNVATGGPWLMFDSHGHDLDVPRRAYLRQLDKVDMVAAALCHKFPAIDGLEADGSLQMQQLNMFEAHPIVPACEAAEVAEQWPELEETLALSISSLGANESNNPSALSCDKVSDAYHNAGPLVHNPSTPEIETMAKSPPKPTPTAPPTSQAWEVPATPEATPAPTKREATGMAAKPPIEPADITGGACPGSRAGSTQVHKTPATAPTACGQAQETPENTPTQKTDATHVSPTNTAASALQTNDDLVRDPITGMLFADPVFCDRGHTHERSCIEAHFRARREMKEEEEARLNREGQNQEDQCGAGQSFDPTCPLTNQPISDILIPNDQCDRMLPVLIESGLIELEEGELEDWRSRREEKTARLAEERRLAIAQQHQEASQNQAGSISAPEPEHLQAGSISTPGPERLHVDSSTARVLRPLAPVEGTPGVFDLGLAVGLCPQGWEKPAGTSPAPRCSNACCRSRLQQEENPACARCSQLVCADCLVFRVEDASRPGENSRQQHVICPDCVLQIRDALPAGSEKGIQLDSAITDFFVLPKQRKAALQHQVLHFQKHQQFLCFKRDLGMRHKDLEQAKVSLTNDIHQAQETAEVAKREAARQEEEEEAATSGEEEARSPREGELEKKVSELRAEYYTIDWDDEDDVIRGSLLEHDLNEAMEALAIARSENQVATSTPSTALGNKRRVARLKRQRSRLESQHSRLESRHARLLAKAPANEEDIDYAVDISRLSNELETVSSELTGVCLEIHDQEEEERKARAIDIAQEEEERKARAKQCAKGRRRSRAGSSRDKASHHRRQRNGPKRPGRRSRRMSGIQQATHVAKALAEFFLGETKAQSASSSSSESSATSEEAVAGEAVAPPEDLLDIETSLPALNAETADAVRADLAAIGAIAVEEVFELPLGLRYPAHRMRNQVRILRTELDLARLESDRQLEEEYTGYQQELESRVEGVEDEVVELRKTAASAQESAEEEQRLQQERRARRERAAQERRRREEERRREQERLDGERQRQEQETRQALQGLDLRQCGKCGFGPFEKFNCNDMAAHNDTFTYMDARGRRQRRRRNECPQCRWTNSDWTRWPEFKP